METDDLVYRKLQKHLDRMPVGFPESESGAEINILKELFTPEEAEIALELSMLPESASRIYPRLKTHFSSVEELEVKLDDMFSKGLIMGGKLLSDDNNKKLYSNAQYVIGIHEMQFDRINKGVMANTINYVFNDFYKEFSKDDVPVQMRTIPIQKSIIKDNYVETYDNIKDLIQGTEGKIVIINCVCKQGMDAVGIPCKVTKTRETCMIFNAFAESLIEADKGRVITKEEAISLVEKFEESGLVAQPENNKNPEFLCFCCGCCCGVLNMIKRFPKPAEHYMSNYYAYVDSDQCEGCGTCTSRCQMDAISLVEEKAVVDLDRCIGCGLCTSTCKTGAVVLARKDKAVEPPRDHNDLYKKIIMKKIGPAAAIKTMIKHKLGMKV
ncbi:MAG TPA: 4Fe-4S binding protein [Spirochaetota bacterium]|nr:4Fe-4S binding protein [Spirochaetota bacterium]HPJ34599.1 4Fe-4S binding protein [Spirochaetota bacterium]